MKKRRLKRKFIKPFIIGGGILVGAIVFLILYLFVFNNIHFLGVKSVNTGAKTYKTKSCLAFYPNTKDGKKVVKDLCDNSQEEAIFDYALVPYGDYYLVEYGNNVHYYIDHDNNPLVINNITDEGRTILAEYLRYDMKKDEIDEAYSLDFIEKTKPENLDIDSCTFNVEGNELLVYFSQYDYTARIPLKYIQKYAGINLGYENETYVKPKYISPNRKTVAFTFDDGPNIKTSSQIVDAFYKYDAVGTFFVVGNRLEHDSVELIKSSIEKGNQYGSHTQSHPYLVLLSPSEAYAEINQPAIDLRDGYHAGGKYDFDGLGYQMTLYRAPYGEHNSAVDEIAPFMSIEWDCDSKDWALRDKDGIKENLYDFESKNNGGLDGCIVLFHDIYQETADAVTELIPELIKKGYQFVTVDELLDILNVDKNKAYYPW